MRGRFPDSLRVSANKVIDANEVIGKYGNCHTDRIVGGDSEFR